jgi:hypothetical protein
MAANDKDNAVRGAPSGWRGGRIILLRLAPLAVAALTIGFVTAQQKPPTDGRIWRQ